jgi:hypothetical protein
MMTLPSHISRRLLILVCVSAISIGSAAGQPGGHLIVLRAANFGWNIALHLQIDGRDVANVVQGRRYDHVIPAGPHVLTVSAAPNPFFRQPMSIRVNVRPGRMYVFTAVWDSDAVVLRPSTLSPAELAKLGL